MAVSSSSTYEFNIGDIVKMAHQMAGLLSAYQSLTAQQTQQGMDFLDLITRSTQTMGLFAKTVQFLDVPLSAGTRNYTLAATNLEVQGDGAFIAVGQSLTAAAGETPVRQVSQEHWQANSAKNATGRPTEYWLDRSGAQVVAYFWPTPNSANAGTVRLQAHRLRANTREGTATLDFEQYWQEYFVCELAARLALANSRQIALVSYLKSEAQQKLELCRAQAQQRGSQQFTISHRSGWSC